VGALAAAVLGVVALRVRGLYLAVATLIFAWMSDSFLLPSPWLGAGTGSSTIPSQTFGVQGGVPFIDLTSRRTLYYVALAVLALVLAGLANLRDTRTGRAFFAVRGSETAAASLGIDVVRTKLVAFALSGALAGLAGNLIMLVQRTVVPGQFIFTVSLQYLAIAVVGGLGSLGGAIAAGLMFAGLNELFFRVTALAGWLDVVSAGLLAVILLLYPGGLAALGRTISSGVRRALNAVGPVRLPGRRRDEPRPSRERPPSRIPASAVAAVGRAGRAILGLAGRLPWVGRRIQATGHRADDWYAAVRRARSNGHGEDPESAAAASAPAQARAFQGDSQEGASLGTLAAVPPELPADREARTPLLETDGVSVRFGGLLAVSEVTLSVREGEIVGLIGPNGAGKTTFFNSVLGLNRPSAGSVRLHGQDVSGLDPHERARLGLARTFQVIQLFGELSVFDNLLVATHLHNRAGLLSNLAASSRTIAAEQEARARVREILAFLRLEDVAAQGARGLPFGVLRMVELGRALVTGSRLIMLDEPASGLNESETDRLSEVITSVRGLGVSILLIEHDVRMVTGVSDYMYVLDRGRLITEGDPAAIRRDPKAIAAYLGQAEEKAAAP
jgi:ABC-type branched-subunit amino acid transport system ATPase component/branched-subunit amino acid ABC-type transport system permease component